MEDNIWHVVPLNDICEHIESCYEDYYFLPYCPCECEPKINQVDGGFVVVHNSFDGREGVEWANEILK